MRCNIRAKNGNGTETNNGRDVQGQNGDGYGMSVSYDLGWGVSASAAMASSLRTTDQNNLKFGHGDRADAYTGGLKYDANNVYLAANYTQTYNLTRFGDFSNSNADAGYANKAQNIELVAQYQFDFGLRPSVAYLQSKGKDLGNGYGDQDSLKYVDVGATYAFNKNMSTYVDYKINLLDENTFTKTPVSTLMIS